MKKLILAGALAILSQSIPAVAATNEKYQFKGENASASFYQYDGCNYTSVYVYAFENVTKNQPGAPTSQKEAGLYYSSYNYCNWTGSSGYGSTPSATFTIDNQLRQASLNGTFTVTDYTGQSKTVNVNLNWTGTGDTFRGNNHSHNTGPGYTSNYRSVGAYREAEVSGSVILDGTNLIANLPSNGYLNSSSNGSVTITRR